MNVINHLHVNMFKKIIDKYEGKKSTCGLSISQRFLVYCNLTCCLDGYLVKWLLMGLIKKIFMPSIYMLKWPPFVRLAAIRVRVVQAAGPVGG